MIWDSVVQGGIITSFSASALIISIALIIRQPIRWQFILIVFLISVIIYFFNFLGEAKDDLRDKPSESALTDKDKPILYGIVAILLTFLLLITFAYGNLRSIVFCFVFLALGIAYTYSLKKVTRVVIGFKDIYVAISWNMIIPFYILFHNLQFNTSIFWLMGIVLCRDLVNASYCDLKDVTVDAKKRLHTFAVFFGKKRLLIFLQVFNAISMLLVALSAIFNYLPSTVLLLLIPILITSFLINRSYKVEIFSTVNVDLEYIVWFVLLISLKIIG
jgi:4-hydroxybenzoate polyprenyltransferase